MVSLSSQREKDLGTAECEDSGVFLVGAMVMVFSAEGPKVRRQNFFRKYTESCMVLVSESFNKERVAQTTEKNHVA